jgi:hypothetical protein
MLSSSRPLLIARNFISGQLLAVRANSPGAFPQHIDVVRWSAHAAHARCILSACQAGQLEVLA